MSDLDYKNKYLKYKNKYFNLKKMIGGGIDAIHEINGNILTLTYYDYKQKKYITIKYIMV